MKCCRDNYDVLLVLKWCLILNQLLNLNQSSANASFTEQILMCVKKINEKQVCILNLFMISLLSYDSLIQTDHNQNCYH